MNTSEQEIAELKATIRSLQDDEITLNSIKSQLIEFSDTLTLDGETPHGLLIEVDHHFVTLTINKKPTLSECPNCGEQSVGSGHGGGVECKLNNCNYWECF